MVGRAPLLPRSRPAREYLATCCGVGVAKAACSSDRTTLAGEAGSVVVLFSSAQHGGRTVGFPVQYCCGLLVNFCFADLKIAESFALKQSRGNALRCRRRP